MTHVRLSLLFALSLLLAVAGQPSHASVIVNGDFSQFDEYTGLPTGWDHFDDGGEVFPPEYVVDGDQRYVRFLENSQLEQTFDLPADALRLSFEYKMLQQGEGTPGVPPDSFQVTLYDQDFNALLGYPVGFFTVDHAGTYFNPLYVSLEPLTGGWQRVILNVVSLSSMDGVLLEFLLNGSDDGRTTTVYVDNVAVSAIPEPASATIFAGLAICVVAISMRRRRRGLK